MEVIGVEAVVEGLSTFLGSMGAIQDAVKGISPENTVLGQSFTALGNIMGNIADFASRTLSVALGDLLSAAIQGTIQVIQDLIDHTIEAGNQFQSLQIRLDSINLGMITAQNLDYVDAAEAAVAMTQDEIKWIQQMAIITPFSATGIASVYTMQRAMGLSDQSAKDLTVSITNWAAGMALPEDSVNNLSDALAKMTSSGKVNALAFRQLRAEYVPIPDILKQMQKDLGKTDAEFQQMQKDGSLAPADFIKAFEEVANKRFPDAAEKIAHTWQGAMNNIQDIFANIGGESIVRPILDTLGQAAGGIVDAFATMTETGPVFTDLGKQLISAADSIGKSLSDIISGVLDLAPSSEDIASGLVGALQGIAKWLDDNKETIIAKIKDIITWVENLGNNETIKTLTSNFQTLVTTLFSEDPETHTTGWQDLAGAFNGLLTAIGGVIDILLPGINLPDAPTVENLVSSLEKLSGWISENQGLLAGLIGFFIGLLIIQFVVASVLAFVGALIGIAASVLAIVVVVPLLVGAFFLIMAVVGTVTLVIQQMQLVFVGVQAVIAVFVQYTITQFNSLASFVPGAVERIKAAFMKQDWLALGQAIMDGIAAGVKAGIANLVAAVSDAARAAIKAAQNILNVKSPSKVFHEIGVHVMEGMANGITAATEDAVGAMNVAIAAMTMPAIGAPSMIQQYSMSAPASLNSTYNNTNQYNLNIQTSAHHEPIVQDFRMLESLAGA